VLATTLPPSAGVRKIEQGVPRAVARTRIRVVFGDAFAIGPGKADLLQAISETGSISAAARNMGMSYRRAWLLIDTMNQCFREPVVNTATGGKGGGGAQITRFGTDVLTCYRKMEAAAAASVSTRMGRFRLLLRKSPPAGKTY
jgi:molybdate transport system regulatory protein